MLANLSTYLAAESTALKRPSNGAPEMKADRVSRGLACQDLLACFFFFCQALSGQGTMSLGRGDERVAPVFLEASANNVDSCAGGELRARHFPAVYSM